MGKYEDWIAKQEIPEEVSLLELIVLGRRLGIDVDEIVGRYIDAHFNELLEAIKDKGIVQHN